MGVARYACAFALVFGGCYYGDFRRAELIIGDGGAADDDAAAGDGGADDDAALDDAAPDDAVAVDAAGPDAVDATPIDAGPSTTLRTGLLAAWPLDGSGLDASGNMLDLAVTGLGYATGRFGQGLQLTVASTGSAKRPVHDVTLRLATGDFAVSAWVNATDVTNGQFIVTQGSSTGGWAVATSSFRWVGRHAPSPLITSAFGDATAGVFRHVIYEREGTALRLYADGVVVGSSTGGVDNPSPSTEVLEVGSYESATTIRFDGIIDDVAIWSRALTVTERAYLDANPVP